MSQTMASSPARRRNPTLRPGLALGLAWVVLIVIASVFASHLTPYDPLKTSFSSAGALPGWAHPLGTDALGRDVLSRLLHGGSDAMTGVLICVAVAVSIGVPTGLAAGYLGGVVDTAASSLASAVMTMPGIVVMLLAISIFGSDVWVGMVAIGALLSSGYFWLSRNSAVATKRELFVDAARVAGLGGLRIALRHILPNISRPLIVQAALTATLALLLQVGISFLGQGAPPPSPQWGSMVREATESMFRYPWLMVPSGGVIALSALAFNLIADALVDRTLPAPPLGLRAVRRAKPAELVEDPMASLLGVEDMVISIGGLVVVDGVSLRLERRKTLAIVGESGCGKTVTSMAIVGLLPSQGRITRGSVKFEGIELALDGAIRLPSLRGRRIGLVSQDPISSLDPAFTIASQLIEPLRLHRGLDREGARKAAIELLEKVEIQRPEAVMESYPHQLSGGMAQRVSIARALTGDPHLLIADEATSALDVTVQSEILDLLMELQKRTGIGVLLVTHDWGVVSDAADDAAVMYAGQIVEQGSVPQVIGQALHPYTAALLRSMPRAQHAGGRLPSIEGSVPSPGQWPKGCRFQNRCGYVVDACRSGAIPLLDMGEGRAVRCIRAEELRGQL